VTGDMYIRDNANLCQDFVDAFVAACTSCGTPQNIWGNNGTCP